MLEFLDCIASLRRLKGIGRACCHMRVVSKAAIESVRFDDVKLQLCSSPAVSARAVVELGVRACAGHDQVRQQHQRIRAAEGRHGVTAVNVARCSVPAL